MNPAIYLLLGGNIGDRLAYLQSAVDLLASRCGNVLEVSPVYETAAWGKEDQQPFLNLAIKMQTSLSPTGLLQCTQNIEQELGRQRIEKWGERTVDIDIIFYGDQVIDVPGLKIPHPLMQERRFVLVPLEQIAPSFLHPVLQKTVGRLLMECTDDLAATPFDAIVQKHS